MAKRAKPGDVVALGAPGGALALVHYLGVHEVLGDVVLVCPELLMGQVEVSGEFFRNGYVIGFPLNYLLRQGVGTVVGYLPPKTIPTTWRRPGMMTGSSVNNWVIDDGSARLGSGEVVDELTDEQAKIAILAILSLEALLDAVSGGWRPDTHGRKRLDV